MADDARYGVQMKGEKGIYQVTGWESLTIEQAATVVGDVTGYRMEYLRDDLLPKVLKKTAANRLESAELGLGVGDVPRWLVSRVA